MTGRGDSRFGAELRRLRNERAVSLRELAARVHHGKTLVWEWETGRKHPDPEDAERLDVALAAGGTLAALAPPPTPRPIAADDERLTYAAEHPRAVDQAAVAALHGVLAGMRRLEDSVGAAPLIAATAGPLRLVETLADEARGEVRHAAVDLAGQWAQFIGWLHAATGRADKARHWYARALEHATEIGNADLTATALSMRGHLAWLARRPGPVVGLSSAAGRQGGASPGVRALAAQQEARGHALMGDADGAARCLDRAQDLMTRAAEHPDREPPWVYFYSPGYLDMQRGLAFHLLGDHAAAIDALTSGLGAVPTDMRRSEFVAAYVLHLATVQHAAGNPDEARRLLDETRAVAAAIGSRRLTADVHHLAARLERRPRACPRTPCADRPRTP